jgi:DNA-binding IclR family transcriptional regulator
MNLHVPVSEPQGSNASQTLMRGLDIVEAVADGCFRLNDLVAHLGLTRATTHRLASALVARDYLTFTPRRGYGPGPKLLKLGFQAQQASSMIQVASPAMDRLAERTLDAVNLGILDDDKVLYLRQSASRRRVVLRHEPGVRNPIRYTALGKALMIGAGPAAWGPLFNLPSESDALEAWVEEMAQARALGVTTHVETEGERVRCIAAPVHDGAGQTIAAISLSTLPQYVEDAALHDLGPLMIEAAGEISRAMGRL